MLSQERHRQIVSESGLASTDGLIRVLLGMASLPYAAAVGLRELSFDFGLRPIRQVKVPVVSIGNITTGGTGKTPCVALVCQLCQELGIRPGIISRGYQSLDGQANDEKLLLELLLPDVPHIQNRKRIVAAKAILSSSQSPAPQMLVMDDGFQHRQLHRDLDIVLVDATNPFGYGYLLPRGLLREPLSALTRADIVLLTRTNQISSEERESQIQVIRKASKREVPVLSVSFEPTHLVNPHGEVRDIAIREHQAVTAFCGIGAPDNFFETIRRLGLELSREQTLIFPDHHHYTQSDLEQIRDLARREKSQAVLMTLKDMVKIRPLLTDIPKDDPFLGRLWALDIAADMSDTDREFLKQKLSALAAR